MKKEIKITIKTNKSNEILIGELDILLTKIYKITEIKIGDSSIEYQR